MSGPRRQQNASIYMRLKKHLLRSQTGVAPITPAAVTGEKSLITTQQDENYGKQLFIHIRPGKPPFTFPEE
ncbi:hypothetical protein GCM10009621_23260 [Corynebacterium felinum]